MARHIHSLQNRHRNGRSQRGGDVQVEKMNLDVFPSSWRTQWTYVDIVQNQNENVDRLPQNLDVYDCLMGAMAGHRIDLYQAPAQNEENRSTIQTNVNITS